MRRRTYLRALGLGAWLLAAGVPSGVRADCADGRPLTVGHRGTGTSSADNPYPENTIPSILAAAREGATMVEIDVQLSADGAVVLMHDPHVHTTTDGMGCVTEMTLDELKALDAGAGTPMAGMGVTVPTLEEVLDQVEIDVNIEIKRSGNGCAISDPQDVADAIADALAGDPHPRFQSVSSFDLNTLDALRGADPSLYIGMLAVTPVTAMVAVERDYDALNLIDGSVDAAAVKVAREQGLEVNVWTIDLPARIEEMFDLDVDSIITNDPPLIEAARAARCGGTDSTGGDEGETEADETQGSETVGAETDGAETGIGGTGAETGAATDPGADGGGGCAVVGSSERGSLGWAWCLAVVAAVRRRTWIGR